MIGCASVRVLMVLGPVVRMSVDPGSLELVVAAPLKNQSGLVAEGTVAPAAA